MAVASAGWICKSASRSRQITMPAPHHSSFFTGRMPFLPPNQQCQSTEGRLIQYLLNKVLRVLAMHIHAQKTMPYSQPYTLSYYCHCLSVYLKVFHIVGTDEQKYASTSKKVSHSNTTSNSSTTDNSKQHDCNANTRNENINHHFSVWQWIQVLM